MMKGHAALAFVALLLAVATDSVNAGGWSHDDMVCDFLRTTGISPRYANPDAATCESENGKLQPDGRCFIKHCRRKDRGEVATLFGGSLADVACCCRASACADYTPPPTASQTTTPPPTASQTTTPPPTASQTTSSGHHHGHGHAHTSSPKQQTEPPTQSQTEPPTKSQTEPPTKSQTQPPKQPTHGGHTSGHHNQHVMTPQADPNMDCSCITPQKVLKGSTVKSVSRIGSACACMALCAANSRCHAFTYNEDQHKCYMKGTAAVHNGLSSPGRGFTGASGPKTCDNGPLGHTTTSGGGSGPSNTHPATQPPTDSSVPSGHSGSGSGSGHHCTADVNFALEGGLSGDDKKTMQAVVHEALDKLPVDANGVHVSTESFSAHVNSPNKVLITSNYAKSPARTSTAVAHYSAHGQGDFEGLFDWLDTHFVNHVRSSWHSFVVLVFDELPQHSKDAVLARRTQFHQDNKHAKVLCIQIATSDHSYLNAMCDKWFIVKDESDAERIGRYVANYIC